MATIETTMYAAPGHEGSPVGLKPRYENFIGGAWVAPVAGKYSENITPATGEPFTEVPQSGAEDIELALDAAHAAKDAWGEASTTERSKVLNRIADAIEENLIPLAVAESWENGKPVRETLERGHPARRRPLPLLRLGDPGRGPARSRRSTRTRSPTTSTSLSAWSGRSSRSTSRC